MTKASFLTLSLVNILVMVACQAGPSERRQNFLTENLQQEDQNETEAPPHGNQLTLQLWAARNNSRL